MKNENYAKGRNDLFSGIVICIFSAAYFIGATQIKIMKMLSASFLNASSIPKLWGVLLFLLGALMILRGVKLIRKAKAEGYVPPKGGADRVKAFLTANRAVVAMFAVLIVYIALIQPVGFLIPTILFLFLEFNILSRKEERKPVFTAVFALVCAVAIYALFKYGFSMPLPQGILKGIF